MTGSVTIHGQLYNTLVESYPDALLSPEDGRNEGLSDTETHTIAVADGPLAAMRETAWHEILECLFAENPALELALRDDLPDCRFQAWVNAMARGLREVSDSAEWRTATGCDLIARYRGGE